MAIYVVMEPPFGNAAAASERAVLVRDGFSLVAFLVPPFWLLWHRLWIEAVLAFAAALLLTALGEAVGFGVTSALLSLLVSIYVGLEGPALRLAALRRRGWRDWGAVEARDRQDAEIRYLSEVDLPERADVSPPFADQPAMPVAAAPARKGPALGLLDYPGRA